LIHAYAPAEQRLLSWPLSYMGLETLAAVSLGCRAWRTPGQARLAWWLLAGSAALEVPNLIINLLLSRGWTAVWAANLPSWLGLATGILVLAGVLAFPRGRESGGAFRRRVLDSLIFAVSILFLLWVMGVHGNLRTAAQGIGLRVFVAYLNAALLGGGLVFMTSYDPDRARGPLGWLAASALAWLAALSCWTLAGLPPVVATQEWIILAGGIPLFQGLAAWSPRRVEEGGQAGAGPERRSIGLLPYLPVSLAIGALAVLLAAAPGSVTRGAFAIFLAMVALLLFRQFLSIQDLQAARRTLEDRVLQRTQALEHAQDTLLRTERMNTLALMGAGLAHDLNNLLCVVKSSAELAVMRLDESGAAGPEDLTRIAVAADRAAHLTGRLMGFARREDEELTLLDLGGAVGGMEVTLRLLLPRSVDLHLEIACESLMVRSSGLRVEQMLVNLVANARDAMPEGGVLTVRTGPGDPEASMALLEVTDNGVGMTPEVQAQIFDPFFTTKAPGKGTGLGLPSLKAMVADCGGRLEVASAVGRGTRFRIFLPLVPALGLSPR
jgi:signal transduction histidine kinase